jgi:hypothetical protein
LGRSALGKTARGRGERENSYEKGAKVLHELRLLHKLH